MKIFCIGRNYIEHAKELQNPVPKTPLVFMKPPSALLRNNKPFYYPEFSNDIHFEVEIVLKIVKNGKYVQKEFAHSYIGEIGLGIDFTARDIQTKLKEKGHPWEIAKGFDKSAVIGNFSTYKHSEEGIAFSLKKNGKTVQKGNTQDMIFPFDDLIVHLSKYFTLNLGDYIFTGTPAGVGPVQIGDILEGFIEDKKALHCEIR